MRASFESWTPPFYPTLHGSIWAYSVSGAFRSYSAGGARVGSCGWAFDTASFRFYGDGPLPGSAAGAASLLGRVGFAMDAGCACSGSSVLQLQGSGATLQNWPGWGASHLLPIHQYSQIYSGTLTIERSSVWYHGALLARSSSSPDSFIYGWASYALSPASIAFP